MEFIFILIGSIVLLGLIAAFAADRLRAEGEPLPGKPIYCCYCGNRLLPNAATDLTDAAHGDG